MTAPGFFSRMMLATAMLCGGCGEEDRDPESAARHFFYTVENGTNAEVFELLAPDAQTRLRQSAMTARAQSGGSQHFKPEDFFILALDVPKAALHQIKLQQIDGDQAKIVLSSVDGKVKETLALIRIDGRWKIALPASL